MDDQLSLPFPERDNDVVSLAIACSVVSGSSIGSGWHHLVQVMAELEERCHNQPDERKPCKLAARA